MTVFRCITLVMSKSFIKILFVFLVPFVAISCQNEPRPKKKISRQEVKEPLIQANKHLVKKEEEDINDYIRRHKWNMTETGSGLRYMIYKEGDGDKTVTGNIVKLDYTIIFITGDTLASSYNRKPMEFMVGKGNIIAGMEEGILLLRKGDKAKFVIPSHLAYGLTGEKGKIPPGSTLIYDLEVLEIN